MKRYKTIIRYFSIVSLFIFTLALMPEVSAQSSTDTLEGVVTVEMKTKDGSVKLYLPADIRAGDTISGSVIDERKNANVSDTLEGAVIDINGQQHKLRDKVFTFVVPATAAGSIPFILRDGKGKKIGRTQIPINQNSTSNFPTPRIGQTGRNLPIPGNFDGSAETTKVFIGGKMVELIAESPRKVVVEIPADTPTGQTNLEIKENLAPQTQEGVRSFKINIVSIQLTADKLNLQRGETTTLYIRVTGLEGLKAGKVFLEVQNRTPSVATLNMSDEWKPSGSNSFFSPINDNDIFKSGYFMFRGKLTGVQTGAFTIHATIVLESMAAIAKRMPEPQLSEFIISLEGLVDAEYKKNGFSDDWKFWSELLDIFREEKSKRK